MHLVENIWGVFLFVLVAQYALTAFPLYKMYKKADLKNPEFAFIPIIGSFKTYNLANLSMWYILLMSIVSCIPIIGYFAVVIFNIYFNVKLGQNFGLNTFGCILCIFFGIFVYWYIALSDNVQFIGELNPKFQENTLGTYNPF